MRHVFKFPNTWDFQLSFVLCSENVFCSFQFFEILLGLVLCPAHGQFCKCGCGPSFHLLKDSSAPTILPSLFYTNFCTPPGSFPLPHKPAIISNIVKKPKPKPKSKPSPDSTSTSNLLLISLPGAGIFLGRWPQGAGMRDGGMVQGGGRPYRECIIGSAFWGAFRCISGASKGEMSFVSTPPHWPGCSRSINPDPL